MQRPSGEGEDAPATSTGGGSDLITAIVNLRFVAAPGHAAPKPQAVTYRMGLFASEGSQEVPVFLGEVDFMAAAGGGCGREADPVELT